MPSHRHLAAACLLLVIASQAASGAEMPRTISVSGQGKASAPPDMAIVNTGVTTYDTEAGVALAANNAAVEKVMEVLKQHSIAAKDIQTSNFSIRPEYERGQRGQRQPRVIGYTVSNSVRVRVRNLPGLGKVLDALVGAGSNQISGISFGIDNSTGIMDEARNGAIADARRRAKLYAHAAGVSLGKVISISEQAAPTPRPQMMGRAMMAMEASSVPVATGEQDVHATVHMVFELTSN